MARTKEDRVTSMQEMCEIFATIMGTVVVGGCRAGVLMSDNTQSHARRTGLPSFARVRRVRACVRACAVPFETASPALVDRCRARPSKHSCVVVTATE